MEMNFTLDSGQLTSSDSGTLLVDSSCSLDSGPHDQLEQIAAITELVSKIHSAADSRIASQIVADELRQYLSVDQVSIGLCVERGVECKLLAVSDTVNADTHTDVGSSAQAALQECIARGELVQWPPADSSYGGGLLCHHQFACKVDATALTSLPLRNANGETCGALLLNWNRQREPKPEMTRFLSAAATPIASSLQVVKRAERGRIHRVLSAAGRITRDQRGRAMTAVFALFMLILACPVTYFPRCECTIEPVTRRFVAAPFSGPLEHTLVQPGDIVDSGQVLAKMDGREVRMELAGTRAELHRASKQRAGYLATLESGQAEVARYEVDRLKARTELLEHRQRNIEIRSPIAGVVVSGDHEDAEGVPMEVGQTLFEIAPLDEMVVEVSIAEDDFAYVRPGMSCRIRLDAFPLRRFNATIQRIHPRAELREDANVFIAEVQLGDPAVAMRPGMRGAARIQADRYPLAWNLFRRPFNAALAWLGW